MINYIAVSYINNSKAILQYKIENKNIKIRMVILCIVLLSKGHFEEITLRQLIFMMFFTLYHGFAESGVNNCAHIVGAIIGFVCGIIIFCQMKKNRAEGR